MPFVDITYRSGARWNGTREYVHFTVLDTEYIYRRLDDKVTIIKRPIRGLGRDEIEDDPDIRKWIEEALTELDGPMKRASLREKVIVDQITWEPGQKRWRGHTVVGLYWITFYAGMEEPYKLESPVLSEMVTYHKTLEDAQDFAQNNFEQKILSAISFKDET